MVGLQWLQGGQAYHADDLVALEQRDLDQGGRGGRPVERGQEEPVAVDVVGDGHLSRPHGPCDEPATGFDRRGQGHVGRGPHGPLQQVLPFGILVGQVDRPHVPPQVLHQGSQRIVEDIRQVVSLGQHLRHLEGSLLDAALGDRFGPVGQYLHGPHHFAAGVAHRDRHDVVGPGLSLDLQFLFGRAGLPGLHRLSRAAGAPAVVAPEEGPARLVQHLVESGLSAHPEGFAVGEDNPELAVDHHQARRHRVEVTHHRIDGPVDAVHQFGEVALEPLGLGPLGQQPAGHRRAEPTEASRDVRQRIAHPGKGPREAPHFVGAGVLEVHLEVAVADGPGGTGQPVESPTQRPGQDQPQGDRENRPGRGDARDGGLESSARGEDLVAVVVDQQHPAGHVCAWRRDEADDVQRHVTDAGDERVAGLSVVEYRRGPFEQHLRVLGRGGGGDDATIMRQEGRRGASGVGVAGRDGAVDDRSGFCGIEGGLEHAEKHLVRICGFRVVDTDADTHGVQSAGDVELDRLDIDARLAGLLPPGLVRLDVVAGDAALGDVATQAVGHENLTVNGVPLLSPVPGDIPFEVATQRIVDQPSMQRRVDGAPLPEPVETLGLILRDGAFGAVDQVANVRDDKRACHVLPKRTDAVGGRLHQVHEHFVAQVAGLGRQELFGLALTARYGVHPDHPHHAADGGKSQGEFPGQFHGSSFVLSQATSSFL